MPNFFLLDLETTGLDPDRCGIIEVAVRLLSPGYELARYHALISPWSSWHWEPRAADMHKASGLQMRAEDEGNGMKETDEELSELMGGFSSEPWYLMGNSVHFDRSFIKRHMPLTMARLHYRQLDVTSVRLWFMLMTGADPLDWDKERAHTAEADVEATLKEANVYWLRRNT